MRVGILSLQHESNTFAAHTTTLASFGRDRLFLGEAVREQLAGTHHEVGGFFDQLAKDGIEAVPVFAAFTMPSGTIAADAADALMTLMLDSVARAGPLDGWLVAPHGSAVAEGAPDFDAYWLTAFRSAIGNNIPVIGTLDLHANFSAQLAATANGWCAYRTNPHMDQHAVGVEAAALLGRTLRGEVRPTTAAAFPRMVVNIESQATAEYPCRELEAAADDLRRRPGVLSVAVLLGFPYADVPEMGAALSVTTDGDPALAKRYADELAEWWWHRRDQFRGNLITVEDAVRMAATAPGPVCLLDMGDNIGAGSPADSTIIAHELIRQSVGPAFVCLNDPAAVAFAASLGIGGSAKFEVGGKTDNRHGRPIQAIFTVRGLYDGHFEEIEARHGGVKRFNQGPTAVVESAELTVMLTSIPTAPFSMRQLTEFGVDPTYFRVLIAKGVHAPVAAYAPVCRTLIRVNTPGLASADLSCFLYKYRRQPLYPFEADTIWMAGDNS